MSVLHSELKAYLDRQAAGGKLRHLYLLTGDEGIGKKTFARNMAKQLLCISENTNKPCNTCFSCRTFDAGTNADYLFIGSDSRNILIEESRRVIEELSLKPINSKMKAVVIADAHKLTVQAQNSILKTIEEPPDHAVIIMTCTDKELLLETIVSRAFHFALKPQENDVIIDALRSATPFSLRYGGGNIGRTAESLDSRFTEKRMEVFHLLKCIVGAEMSDANENAYIDDLERNLHLLLLFLRDILIIKVHSKCLINIDMERELRKTAEGIDYQKILELIKKVKRAMEFIDSSTNKKIVLNNLIYGNQGGTL
jgi:DNA polymerase III subunit delta'